MNLKRMIILFFELFIFSATYSSEVQAERYGIPEFQIERYLGEWYEIVRKDHSFEKGLDRVTAEYKMTENGKIQVINRGYRADKGKDRAIKGRAKIKYKNINNILRVSFLWPFYSDYIVMDYDRENYSYVLVRGKSDRYLWILSRKPFLDKEIIDKLLKKAESDGINLDDIIYVKQ